MQQRELRALSRENVAGVTRIPHPLLRALEEDRFEDLPGDVFAVGYIRAYARCIGLNADETVLRFQELRRGSQPAPPTPRRKRRPWLWMTLVAGGALGAAAALLLHR